MTTIIDDSEILDVGRLYEMSRATDRNDYDWALIEISANLLDLFSFRPISASGRSTSSYDSMDSRQVVAYTASGGKTSGYITKTAAFLKMPGHQNFEQVLVAEFAKTLGE